MGVKKNYLYTTLYQILLIIIPFVTVPYLSRLMGPKGVGVYSYVFSISSYFVLFAKLGLNNYGTRSIAKIREDKDALKETFLSIYYSQVLISVLLLLVYLLYIVNWEGEYSKIAFIQTIFVASVLFDIDWFYFGLEKFRYVVTRNVFIKVITTIAIFVFVKHENDLWLYAVIMSLGTLINNLVLWFGVKGIIAKYKAVKFIEIKKHFLPSLKLFIPVLAMSIYRTMDKIMLGQMSTMAQVGFYENAEKVIYLLMGFVSSLGKVTMPRMTSLIAKGDKESSHNYIERSMKFIIIMTSALAFGIAGISKEFAPVFFGTEFMESGNLIQYLSITIIIIAWANVLRTQYIIPHMKDSIYIVSICIGAVLNVVSNVLLIRSMGAMGAVIGTIIAESSAALIQTFLIRRELQIIILFKKNCKNILGGLIMFAMVKIIGSFMGPSILTVVIQIIAGGIFYLSYTYLVDKRFVKMLLNRQQT